MVNDRTGTKAALASTVARRPFWRLAVIRIFERYGNYWRVSDGSENLANDGNGKYIRRSAVNLREYHLAGWKTCWPRTVIRHQSQTKYRYVGVRDLLETKRFQRQP